jgi:hypothetical protein
MFLLSLYISSVLGALEPSRPVIFWTARDGKSSHVFDDSSLKIKNILTRTDPSKKMLSLAFVLNKLDYQTVQDLKSDVTQKESLSSIFLPFVSGSFKISSSHSGTRMNSWKEFVNADASANNVVVFEPRDTQELHLMLKQANEYASNSQRKVGIMVTAVKPKELPVAQSPYKGVIFTEVQQARINGTTQFTGPVSVTPFTFQALIVCTLLFFGMCIGNTCMSEIQVPITYLHKELLIRKEY